MTTRTDIPVTYVTSPRIAEVEAPSIEVTMQDLVDTLRIDEEGFHKGLSFDKLLNASGKDDLGGGVKVGITVALQNTLLAFEGRTTPAESGTITTASSAPISGLIQLIDTGADFISAAVSRGSFGINYTDRSVFEVFSVDSANQLTVKVPVNGTDNDFDISDDYDIFNVIQVRATGGNLVAVDDVGDPLDTPVLPTFGTQVLITASSSATLQELENIQYSSFEGAVHVATTSGFSGTDFPTGTPQQPVNNLIDALTIASERGLTALHIMGDITLNGGLDYTGFIIKGNGIYRSTIDLSSSAILDGVEFFDCTLTGVLDSSTECHNVLIGSLSIGGDFIGENCILQGPITFTGTNSDSVHFFECFGNIPGQTAPSIDMGGGRQGLGIRGYNGGVDISNKTGSAEVSVGMNSGQVTLENTVTAGNITISGVGKLTDNSVGATVNKEIIQASDIVLIKQMEAGNVTITGDGPWTITVLDEDDVTTLATFTISADRKTRTRTS